MKIHYTLFCWLICLLAQHHTFLFFFLFCYNFSLHEEMYRLPTKESIISALRDCCESWSLLYTGQSLVHWLAGGRMTVLTRIYRQRYVHFLGWCAVWLSALLFHTSVSCVTVFSTRLIHSVVITQCSKDTTSSHHCRDRCMIIKYKSGGTVRTSTKKWNQTDD